MGDAEPPSGLPGPIAVATRRARATHGRTADQGPAADHGTGYLPVPPPPGPPPISGSVPAHGPAGQRAAERTGEPVAGHPPDGADPAAPDAVDSTGPETAPARTIRLPVVGEVPARHLGTAVAALSLAPAVVTWLTDGGPEGAGTNVADAASRARTAAPVPGVQLPAAVTVDHLLARTTYGATPALRAEVARVGMATWLARQLAPTGLPDPEGDAVLAAYPLLAMSPREIKDLRERRQGAHIDAPADLQAAHVGRAMVSSRQLFEVMVGFWSDHFTVPVTAQGADVVRADYDATVIRRHALGRFEDLLVAVANHPAMMLYLNLSGSTRRMPNENFARELLELHTVGVDGGYGEGDVKQAARLLTGMRVEDDLSVRYHPNDHDVGTVKVMGFTTSNRTRAGGPVVARALYRYLAHHPSTARFLATKLARRFVVDDPPAALVQRLAAVYLANDTRIVPVLVALFRSPEFGAAAGHKLRRPMELVVAAGRALGVRPGSDPDGLRDLARTLDDVGHAPFRWTTPNGYPDVAAAWQSAGQALGQWRIMARFLSGRDEHGVGVKDPTTLLTAPASATTSAAVADQLARRYLGRPPNAAELAAVHLALPARGYPKKLRAGSDSQRRAVVNASYVLLQSPAFLTR